MRLQQTIHKLSQDLRIQFVTLWMPGQYEFIKKFAFLIALKRAQSAGPSLIGHYGTLKKFHTGFKWSRPAGPVIWYRWYG
jgi:hypothetical protein